MSRRTPTALVAATATLAVAAVLAACGSSPADTPAGTARPTASGDAATTTPPAATGAPGAASEALATDAPAESAVPDATEESQAPTEAPAATPGPSPGADGCSGSAENRDFFAGAAEAMSWDVYCAVLPEGWFVETGAYRLADGGRLDITYRGPGGERIEIRQGAWCTGGIDACAPRERDLGPTRFGDRDGMLVALGPAESDGYAVYVDPGERPSWAIVGTGIDEATFTAIAAALHPVSP